MKLSDDEDINQASRGVALIVGIACISIGVGSYFGLAFGFALFGACMLFAGIFAK